MSAFPGPANPIFYSQFRIRGGWRNIAIFSGLYGCIIGGLIWFTASSSNPRHYAEALRGWLDGLLGLQVFLLLLFGSSRVSATVRADVTGKIIESHRLMPVSAFSAIIGYITGAPIQAISMGIVNFILGVFAAGGAGVEVQRWVIANGMLAAFVLLVWVITAQLAFTTRGGFLLLIIVVAIALFSSGMVMILLPALSVLTCPILGRSVFDLQSTFTNVTFTYCAALVSQFVLGAIFFSAAMRKYRLPDAVGFSVTLGLLLLLVWIAISLLGMSFIDEFAPGFYRNAFNDLKTTQFVASIVASMLLAILPIASSARANDEFRRYDGPASTARRPMRTFLTCALATAIILLFFVLPPRIPVNALAAAMLYSSLVVLASITSMAFLFRWAYGIRSKAGIIVVIWLVLMWVAPLVGDAMYRSLADKGPDYEGIISTLSPIGALIAAWHSPHLPLIPGIVFQCGMMLLPVFLYSLASRRKARQITVTDGSPASAVVPSQP